MDEQTVGDLLQFAIHILARAAMPPEKVQEVVGSAPRQIKAFNLCDGRHTLVDIGREAKINSGNLSRTIERWEKEGVVFRLGEGRGSRPLHVYAIPKNQKRAGRG